MDGEWTKNIKLLCHSSIRIDGERVIYFDPFQISGQPHDGELIFITHDHYDHFSREDIEKVKKDDTIIILPEKMAAQAAESGFSRERTVAVRPGGTYEAGGIRFETVAAYNIVKPFHPKGSGWTGYVVTMNGVRYYVAGDTDFTSEAGNVDCDVALVPVGGTYTMNGDKAAKLVNTIRPKAAVPTHYGAIVGKKEDADRFCRLLDSDIACEILLD